MKLTENFNLLEFICHDGTRVPDELIPNVKELAENLQVIRDELNEPLHVNSGYRTPSWNKRVGGVASSQHLLGKAADLTCKSKSPRQLAKIIEGLIKEGKIKQGGLGIYPGFVHYDIRGVRARW